MLLIAILLASILLLMFCLLASSLFETCLLALLEGLALDALTGFSALAMALSAE